MKNERVFKTDADMCQFNLKSEDADGNGLVMKPTRFMSNSMCIIKRLSERCTKKEGIEMHRHVQLTCGRARDAAKYTEELCRAICRGLIEQKELDRSVRADVRGGDLKHDQPGFGGKGLA